MESKAKPPIYYIQKFYRGENKLNSLGNWMLREVISYLDVDDFFSFVRTCTRLRKFATDAYVRQKIDLNKSCLLVEEPNDNTFIDVEFITKIKQGNLEPVYECLDDPMCLDIFYYNTKRKLIYSLYRDHLKVSKIGTWSDKPSCIKTIDILPDVKNVQGFGKQFYFSNSTSLMSLHEGPVEGLPFNEWEGWSTLVIDMSYEPNQKLELCDGGQTVILGQGTQVMLFNYRLEMLFTIPIKGFEFNIYTPVKSSQAFFISDSGNFSLHHTYPSEAVTLQKTQIGGNISKVEGCKYGKTQAVVYQSRNVLMINKRKIGPALAFSTFKNFLFIFDENKFRVIDMNNFEVRETFDFECKVTNVWMHVDNFKLVTVFTCNYECYLGILPHHSNSLLQFRIPLCEYSEIFYRAEVLVVKGWVFPEISSIDNQPVSLLYNLNKLRERRVFTPRQLEQICTSNYSKEINSPNFLKNHLGTFGFKDWNKINISEVEFIVSQRVSFKSLKDCDATFSVIFIQDLKNPGPLVKIWIVVRKGVGLPFESGKVESQIIPRPRKYEFISLSRYYEFIHQYYEFKQKIEVGANIPKGFVEVEVCLQIRDRNLSGYHSCSFLESSLTFN